MSGKNGKEEGTKMNAMPHYTRMITRHYLPENDGFSIAVFRTGYAGNWKFYVSSLDPCDNANDDIWTYETEKEAHERANEIWKEKTGPKDSMYMYR